MVTLEPKNLPLRASDSEIEPRGSFYPKGLIEEYHVLAQKDIQGFLTPADIQRYKEVCEEINAWDCRRLRPAWDIQAQKVEESLQSIEDKLAQLRAEIEALPDAIRV